MAGKALHTITEDDVGKIIDFIRDVAERTGCEGAVVGASGGLDSATTIKLCADALGPENVMSIFMPSQLTPENDRVQTEGMSASWGTGYEVINMQPAVDALTKTLVSDVRAPLERGNISARCRMIALFNRAKKLNFLVAGTTNRSEYMMGYFTKFGDGAYDLDPMIDLYKTQVWQVAEIIGVPRTVIEKVPTAGLWEGQTDEDEMGITYRDLDLVLNGISFGLSDGEIAKDNGIDISKISDIRCRISAMGHKRALAYRPDIGFNDL